MLKHWNNYSCRHCERHEIETPIQTACKPKPVISGSLASPSILAHIMTQKYVEGLPLYRQEKQFQRMGVSLSRQTFANWMIMGAERWLSALYHRMHELPLERDILHADETTLQVLRELGRSVTSTSYLWLYRTGIEEPPIILIRLSRNKGWRKSKKISKRFQRLLAGRWICRIP